MEKKSMGQFIAVLRKAKGMTQRELAEGLGVSDKAISRWERDECSPDISALPVLAEIFDITVDELLRGERNPREDTPTKAATEKSEKQMKRLLKLSREKYQKRSIISVGIALVGLIVGAICNFAFLRGYLGSYLSLAFILIAAVCQSLFTVDAFSTLRDSEVDGDTILKEKSRYIKTAYFIFSLIGIVLAPCIMFGALAGGPYFGIDFDDWLGYSSGLSAVFAVVLLLGYAIMISVMKKKGLVYVPEKEKEKAPELKKLFRVMLLKAVALLAVTVTVFGVYTTAVQKSHSQKFTDLEEFKAYMETPVEYDGFELMTTMTVPTLTEESDTEPESEYDESGEIYYEFDVSGPADYVEGETYIFEDGYIKEKLYSQDGSEVLLEYVHRNEAVSVMDINWKDGKPTIYIMTYSDTRIVNELCNSATAVFFTALLAEAAALVYDYMRKRKKVLSE